MVQMFNDGGGFMWPILVCLVLGVAISLERLITLGRASVNTRKFYFSSYILGMTTENIALDPAAVSFWKGFPLQTR